MTIRGNHFSYGRGGRYGSLVIGPLYFSLEREDGRWTAYIGWRAHHSIQVR